MQVQKSVENRGQTFTGWGRRLLTIGFKAPDCDQDKLYDGPSFKETISDSPPPERKMHSAGAKKHTHGIRSVLPAGDFPDVPV